MGGREEILPTDSWCAVEQVRRRPAEDWRRAAPYGTVGAVLDVPSAEGMYRVEHLVVHVRARERVAPRGGGHRRRHVRRVLEQEHVVAVALLAEQRLELLHLSARPFLYWTSMRPCSSGTSLPSSARSRARRFRPRTRWGCGRRGRRVRLVVRPLELLRLVRRALDLGLRGLPPRPWRRRRCHRSPASAASRPRTRTWAWARPLSPPPPLPTLIDHEDDYPGDHRDVTFTLLIDYW